MAKKTFKHAVANDTPHAAEIERAAVLVRDCLFEADSIAADCDIYLADGEAATRLAVADMLLRCVHAERRDIALLRVGAAVDAC